MIALTRRYQRNIYQNIKDHDAKSSKYVDYESLHKFLSAYLVCATEARRTTRRLNNFVDVVG